MEKRQLSNKYVNFITLIMLITYKIGYRLIQVQLLKILKSTLRLPNRQKTKDIMKCIKLIRVLIALVLKGYMISVNLQLEAVLMPLI